MRLAGEPERMAGMGQRVWVAILGLAALLFSALGLFFVFLSITHRISHSEGWAGLGMSAVMISVSYRALRHRITYNAIHSQHPANSRNLPPNPLG